MTTDSWGVTPANTFQFQAHGRTFGVQIAVGGFVNDFYVRLLELVGDGWADKGVAYDAASVPWDAGITAAGGIVQFAQTLVSSLNSLLAAQLSGSPTNPGTGPTDWESFATWFIARLSAAETAQGAVLTFTP